MQGSYLVAEEARAVWERQGLRGSLVLTTSVNAVVSKKGSLAYDASKAAANHLVRGLAVELAPLVRVNGLAPATVVSGSTMFPRDRVISSLVKYGIAFAESEDTDSLRHKLSEFYAERTPVSYTHLDVYKRQSMWRHRKWNAAEWPEVLDTRRTTTS